MTPDRVYRDGKYISMELVRISGQQQEITAELEQWFTFAHANIIPGFRTNKPDPNTIFEVFKYIIW